MAPSPTIPTSFVPKQPVKSAARFTKSGSNAFLILSLFVFGVAVFGALSVFAYGAYLRSVAEAKAAELAAAEAGINVDAVESFVRSRDRFAAAGEILDGHLALSRFFDLLERMTLVNVRYDSFQFTMLPEGVGEIQLSGSARSFNALAAQSAAFSSEKEIKRAIFSEIQVAENGTVSFSVTAEVDPDLLEFVVDSASSSQAPAAVPAAPATTTMKAATTTLPAGTTTPSL